MERYSMAIIDTPGYGIFYTFGGLMLFYALTILGGGAITGYLGLIEITLGSSFLVLGLISFYYPGWNDRKTSEAEKVTMDKRVKWPPEGKSID
jgi:cadmium resistance protein CadD (predicted permease)